MAKTAPDRTKWFLLTPTNEFVDLMFQMEDEEWDFDKFLQEVEKHFRMRHPKQNKGKNPKRDSVIQKMKGINDELKERGEEPFILPSWSQRVSWADIARKRRRHQRKKNND